ncbi:transcription factor TFIIIB subunit brf1 [Tulasnella sp. 403]|nr:transcription factor TFIIIB subunit brf1 [Tulasnella sp. 403]
MVLRRYSLPEDVETPPIIKEQERKKIRMSKRKRKREEMPRDQFLSRMVPRMRTAKRSPLWMKRSGIFRGVGLGTEDLNPTDGTVNEEAESNAPFHPEDGLIHIDTVFDPTAFTLDHAGDKDDDDLNYIEITNEVETYCTVNKMRKYELDRYLLSEEEVKLKTRVWVELNRDYLEKLAETPTKAPQFHNGARCESVGHLRQKKKFSRKINYDAVKNLFKMPSVSEGRLPLPGGSSYGDLLGDDEEKDDEELGRGLSAIDPDPDYPAAEDDHVPQYNGFGSNDYGMYGEGDKSFNVADDYCDDGGYLEEV